jgi:predicted nucleic acid-binding protein
MNVVVDAKFLECCLAANARYFITGDHDFATPMKFGNTIVLSVSLFQKFVCSHDSI